MMTGIIWFVQIVHYPLFLEVPDRHMAEYERQHTHLTSWVVVPLMTLELASALSFVFLFPQSFLWWSGLVWLIFIWISTFFIQVPLHQKLTRSGMKIYAKRLDKTNWLRTLAWSIRSGILLFVTANV